MAADQDETGLNIVLTPVQLAAVLQGATLTREHTMSNRFWGALSVIGGAVEMVASAPLWLAPEPLSKVAAGAIDFVATDTASTGLRQVWTGDREIMLTEKVVASSLRSLGVDPSLAESLGASTATTASLAAFVMAPLAVARTLNATRVWAVFRGRINLKVEDTFPGAHNSDHYGRTIQELQQRLVAKPWTPAASTFRTIKDAEVAVTEAIKANAPQIKAWAANATIGTKQTFKLKQCSVQGIKLSRTGQQTVTSGVTIVLKKYVAGNRIYYVLTSFPS